MSKFISKIFIVFAFCLVCVFTFSACKDKNIFADSDDFQSYPEYWNNFNSNGDIYLPNAEDSNSDNNDNNDSESDNTSDSTSSEDFTANFSSDDDTSNESNNDSPNDNTSSDVQKDDDVSSDTTSSKDSNTGNHGPLVFF